VERWIINESDTTAGMFIESLNDRFLHQNVISPSFQANFCINTYILDFILTDNCWNGWKSRNGWKSMNQVLKSLSLNYN
jgi:hypothetical protein